MHQIDICNPRLIIIDRIKAKLTPLVPLERERVQQAMQREIQHKAELRIARRKKAEAEYHKKWLQTRNTPLTKRTRKQIERNLPVQEFGDENIDRSNDPEIIKLQAALKKIHFIKPDPMVLGEDVDDMLLGSDDDA